MQKCLVHSNVVNIAVGFGMIFFHLLLVLCQNIPSMFAHHVYEHPFYFLSLFSDYIL